MFPFSAVGLSQTKLIYKMLGLDLGPPRLPLTTPPSGEVEKLRKALSDVGFFDWIKTD